MTISLQRREKGGKRREIWIEAMKGTGEERCSRRRRDVRRVEELEDCSEGRIWIRLNFLLRYIFMLLRNLSSYTCSVRGMLTEYGNKIDRVEKSPEDEKWCTLSGETCTFKCNCSKEIFTQSK